MTDLTFNLTGKSIAKLREEGCPMWSDWHEGDNFEKKTTKPRTITIPKEILLEGSLGKTFQEQKELVEKEGLVVLEANEIVEMLWLHKKKTGKWYTEYWLRANTLNDSGSRVSVESYFVHGVVVSDWHDDAGSSIGVAASREIPLKVEKLKSVPVLNLEKRLKNLEKIVSKLTKVIKI